MFSNAAGKLLCFVFPLNFFCTLSGRCIPLSFVLTCWKNVLLSDLLISRLWGLLQNYFKTLSAENSKKLIPTTFSFCRWSCHKTWNKYCNKQYLIGAQETFWFLKNKKNVDIRNIFIRHIFLKMQEMLMLLPTLCRNAL